MTGTKDSCLSRLPENRHLSIYVDEEEVQEASEKMVKVKVRDGNKLGIYKGTMLHSEELDRYSGLPCLSFYNGYPFCKATRWNTH